LAKEANNHFGIKCHENWNGATFIQDDDTKNECFRSYKSADESYNDHSLFLTGRKRYAALFDLELTDYKGWAKGLKTAGYATNPKYAQLLIDIIERFNLFEYDSNPELALQQNKEKELTASNNNNVIVDVKPTHTISNPENKSEITYEVTYKSHQKYTNHNNVTYVKAQAGDTFYKIAKEFGLGLQQLYKYNEFNKKDVLKEGDIIYIVPKKSKAKKGNNVYVCAHETTLREIAHAEGLKLNSLLKLNLSENPDEILTKGTKVILR